MAVHFRRPARPLIEDLRSEPYRYDLFQAIAILERFNRGCVPLGTGMDPEVEAVRIEQEPGLGFPASDVSGLREDADGMPVLRTPALGVAGIGGPLPYAFTETLTERVARRDTAMASFLNMFNHRLVSLLYRVRRSTLPLLDGQPEYSLLATALRSFAGIGTPGLEERVEDTRDRMLLGFTAILADRRRSAAGLRALIAGVFAAEVSVGSFEGRWLDLEPDSHTRLAGANAAAGGLGTSVQPLGQGALLGTRVWDQHAGFRLAITVARLDAYSDFLPTGRHYGALVALCRFYAGDTLDIILDLTLRQPAVPAFRLATAGGRRLGWTTWLLGASEAAADDGQVRIVIASQRKG
ncbi:type VI secretion system baseplate subunit TssG [Caenispirillum bisanense]|uniref:type VI secretion system baseplate subunit TssG n=1 Tax=Caenispirillum bisanense TaxID=414052 RepID=UPI0031DFC734